MRALVVWNWLNFQLKAPWVCVEMNESVVVVVSFFLFKICPQIYAFFMQEELSDLKKQFLEAFSPDEAYPLGAPLFMETPRPCSPLAQVDSQAFDEVRNAMIEIIFWCHS